jgi:DNA invertase Pin-like site-specific DNA recombinase
MKKTRYALSYARFSSGKQAEGDSQDRQAEAFASFCERHKLVPMGDPIVDEGRSGYTDAHRKRGKLGTLIRECKDGRYAKGTVIVVEAWGRLGRLRPDKQTELVKELLKTGVDIGICRLGDIFTLTDFGTTKWIIFSTFAQLAYEESRQKSERVRKGWAKLRKKLRDKERRWATSNLPAWLRPVRNDRGEVVDVELWPERVGVVRKIFDLAAKGLGYGRLIRRLIKDGVEPFYGKWTPSYVRDVLNDRRALGEYQPCRLEEVDGEQVVRHVPDGKPLKNYYPPIISQAEFDDARRAQECQVKGKDTLGRRIVRKQSKYANVFKGLLRHARDGEGMMVTNAHSRERPYLVLINFAGVCGRTRPTYKFSYGVLEKAVLTLLKEVEPPELMPRARREPSRVDGLRERLAEVRANVEELKAEVKRKFSPALADALREQEEAAGEIEEQIRDEEARASADPRKAWERFPSLADQVAAEGDDARLRLRAVLRAACGVDGRPDRAQEAQR